MPTFTVSVDHVIKTRVDVEVQARTLADAKTVAKRAVIPQSNFNRDIKMIKRRSRSTIIDVVDAHPSLREQHG